MKLEIVNDPQGQLTHKLKVEPKGAKITYKPLPYELGNLSGELVIEPEGVLVDIRGSDPVIQIAGHLRQHNWCVGADNCVACFDENDGSFWKGHFAFYGMLLVI